MSQRSPIPTPTTDEDREDLTAIAFVFLACSELTDHDLSTPEMGAIVSRLHTWLPVGEEHDVERALREAVALYEACDGDLGKLARLDAMTMRLAGRLSRDQRVHIITDLIAIARADGAQLESENQFIEAAARTFDVPIERAKTP